MRLFLLAISVLWLLIRLTAITNPLKIKKLYSRMITRAKVLFFLPLIAGMLFLWARPQSQDKFHSKSPTFFHSSYALPPPSFLRFLAL